MLSLSGSLTLGLGPRGGGAPAPSAPTFNTIVIEGDSQSRNVTHPEEAGADTAGFFTTLWKATATGKTVHIRAVNSRDTGPIAQLDDNSNTLIGNVAEDAAYDPDLITYMIGANDFTTATDASYRTDLTNLFAARKAAQPAVKVAWSPPLPYNPTGTPHPNKANFDTQRASLMANARTPAVWGQWADYYIPLGEHPDFADAATAAPLFGDAVHPSAAGHALLATTYAAAMDTLLDPTRLVSDGPYEAVWPANESSLTPGERITRRLIVSGLAWAGHAGGYAISGDGSPSILVGGQAPSGYAYNGDVVDYEVDISASAETDATISLTIGGETRPLTYTSAAAVTPVSYLHGDIEGKNTFATSFTTAAVTWGDGIGVIFVARGAPTAITVNGVGATQHTVQTAGGRLEVWLFNSTAGSYPAVLTYPNMNDVVVSMGTIIGADTTPIAAVSSAPASQSPPHLVGSVTIPANGYLLAAFRESGGASITPATANNGTLLDEGNVTGNGETHGIALSGHNVGGATQASFNFAFGTFARMGIAFKALGT